jgi:ketosteroid isomerase-like protein
MMMKNTLILLAGCASLAGCNQAGVDIEVETAALRAAADAYHAAGNSKNIDTVVSNYTSDSVTLPPNAASANGLDGMREFAIAFTQLPGFSMSFGEMVAGVGAGGDMGYTLVDTIIRFDGPDGNPIEDSVRDFHLWRKDGGEWKISVDIWNSELPLPVASANPLEGAWIVTGWTDAEGNVQEEPQPALYVFTTTHYSVMIARGSDQRATYEGDDLTDAEKLGAYDTIIANSGRYEIEGNILKTRAYVAKDPNYMGGWPENEVNYEFERDGDTLTIENLGFDEGTTGTFMQVEGTPTPW